MNSFGHNFKVTIYGASHESSFGVIIDGVQSGLKIDKKLINEDLSRRRPQAIGTTSRIEQDTYTIKNGIFNEHSTGSAINIEIQNTNIKSADYNNLIDHPRPSHADFVARKKYRGFNDYRGGGIFSGRLTAALVAAGSIAKMLIPFKFNAIITKIGTEIDPEKFDNYLLSVSKLNDSVGGIIKITIKDVGVGLGDPLFNKLDARLSYMLQSIPGVKGVSFGADISEVVYGSKFNDCIIDETGKTLTNNAGGINGGISNGNDIIINVSIKPTSSIKAVQNTYSFKADKISPLIIEGRHDVAFVRRLPVVLENACAIVLADYYLGKGY